MKLILNIEPKPQSRPRFSAMTRTVHEDRRMKTWREQCRLLVKNQYIAQPMLEGPLKADVRFYIHPPQYVAKPKKNQAALQAETIPVGKKPDIDNYEKALYDSMSGIVLQDDGQIALHTVGKFYSLNPRIEVTIEKMEEAGGI